MCALGTAARGLRLTWPSSPRHLQEPQRTLEAMLRPKVTTLPGHIQAVYVQNVLKLYASILQQEEQAGQPEAAQQATQLLLERLPQFVQSADLEVQERVRPGPGQGSVPRPCTGGRSAGSLVPLATHSS